MPKKIIIAVTGASGAVYAKLLLDKLELVRQQFDTCNLVFSSNAKQVWLHELNDSAYDNYPYKVFDNSDFNAPFASGSAQFDTMIIIPCSMGTMGRIASGISNDLITRAADVVLKERRKLILVTRDMPLNLIHINNMKTITLSGGIICPAMPSFYSLPRTIEDLAATVVNRVMDLAGFNLQSYRWNEI